MPKAGGVLFFSAYTHELKYEPLHPLVVNVDAMKSSGFKGTNISNEINLINSNNLANWHNTAIFYSMC